MSSRYLEIEDFRPGGMYEAEGRWIVDGRANIIVGSNSGDGFDIGVQHTDTGQYDCIGVGDYPTYTAAHEACISLVNELG